MAVSWRKDVYSSTATAVGFDDDTKELLVWWKGGKCSAYAGVPEEMAAQVSMAPSVGAMLNEEIKPYYRHRYV